VCPLNIKAKLTRSERASVKRDQLCPSLRSSFWPFHHLVPSDFSCFRFASSCTTWSHYLAVKASQTETLVILPRLAITNPEPCCHPGLLGSSTMAAADVSSTRLYLGNLPSDGTHTCIPTFAFLPWMYCPCLWMWLGRTNCYWKPSHNLEPWHWPCG